MIDVSGVAAVAASAYASKSSPAYAPFGKIVPHPPSRIETHVQLLASAIEAGLNFRLSSLWNTALGPDAEATFTITTKVKGMTHYSLSADTRAVRLGAEISTRTRAGHVVRFPTTFAVDHALSADCAELSPALFGTLCDASVDGFCHRIIEDLPKIAAGALERPVAFPDFSSFGAPGSVLTDKYADAYTKTMMEMVDKSIMDAARANKLASPPKKEPDLDAMIDAKYKALAHKYNDYQNAAANSYNQYAASPPILQKDPSK